MNVQTLNRPAAGSMITLQKGDHSNHVKEIQEKLKQLGYYTAKIDSIFGPLTDRSVKQFQQDYLLTVDGIFGPMTKAELEKTFTSTANYRMGDNDLEVKTIQRQLTVLGLYNNIIDGIFGRLTVAAVKSFQKMNTLVIDGIVGVITKSALQRKCSASSPLNNNAASINPKDKHRTATIITAEQLEQMGWININDDMVQDLNATLVRYNITTPQRIRHFISQCAHESGRGRYVKEIADGRRYEFRKDLGNVNPGDGPKYKGAGFIQLTGKFNYQNMANEIGDPRIMEGVDYVSKKYPWMSAGFWWNKNNMNALIDSGASVKQVTKKVNGGFNGLAERETYYARSSKIFV